MEFDNFCVFLTKNHAKSIMLVKPVIFETQRGKKISGLRILSQ